MVKISKYFDSGLDKIIIKHGGNTFTFSLIEELKIDDSDVSGELQEQPSHFAFLSLLKVKLEKKKREIEFDLKTQSSNVYKHYKDAINRNTGKPYSNDYIESQIHIDSKYNELSKSLIKILHDLETMEVCVESFKQRSFILLNLNNNQKID